MRSHFVIPLTVFIFCSLSVCANAQTANKSPAVAEAAEAASVVVALMRTDFYKEGKFTETDLTSFVRDGERCLKAIAALQANPATVDAKLDINGMKDLQPLAAMKERCESFAQTGRKGLEAKADSAGWPGDANVGNVAKLKSATLSWWKTHNQELLPAYKIPNEEIVAVAVRSDWLVGAVNVHRKPTRWDVNVVVAISNPELRRSGMAKMMKCNMVTREFEGVEAQTPFANAVCSTPTQIRLDKLPKS